MLPDFTCLLIAFLLTHPEFAPGQKSPVVPNHGDRLPPGAVFRYAHEGYPRSGHYMPNGNQVVPTIIALMAVNHGGRWHPSAFRFTHSAFPIGRELAIRSSKLKGTVEDGKIVRVCTAGKYNIAAERKTRNGGGSYFVPKATLLGVVGEQAGHTLD